MSLTNHSLTWVEAQWNEMNLCNYAPNLISSFITPNYLSDQKAYFDYNKSWSIHMYALSGMNYPLTKCGSATMSLPEDQLCCTSFINRFIDAPQIQSASTFLLSKDTESTQLFRSAEGTTYCDLIPQSGLIYQYSSIRIKKDGSCSPIRINNSSKVSIISFSCSSTGVLSIYRGYECKKSIASYQLPIQITNLTNARINASTSIYSGGVVDVGWAHYFPGAQLIPLFDNPIEVISLTFVILALLAFIICVIKAAVNWRNTNRRTDMLLTIICGIFAINSVLQLIIDNSELIDHSCEHQCSLPFYNALLTYNLFKYTAELLLVFYSGIALFRILNLTQFTKTLVVVSLIAISLITNFGIVVKFLLLVIAEYSNGSDNLPSFFSIYSIAINSNSWVSQWTFLQPYWTLFMFCWNTIPMNIALYQIANTRKKNDTFLQSLENALSFDKKGIITIFNNMHILIIICFYILSYFIHSTLQFGNDRTQMAVLSITKSIIAYHCIINIFFTDRVKVLLAMKLKKKPVVKVESVQRSKDPIAEDETNLVNMNDPNNFPMQLLVKKN